MKEKSLESLNNYLFSENEKLNAIIDDLEERIYKSKEYIVKNCILSDEWKELDFCNFIPTGKITYKQLTPKKVKELLEILGGKND